LAPDTSLTRHSLNFSAPAACRALVRKPKHSQAKPRTPHVTEMQDMEATSPVAAAAADTEVDMLGMDEEEDADVAASASPVASAAAGPPANGHTNGVSGDSLLGGFDETPAFDEKPTFSQGSVFFNKQAYGSN